MTDKLRFKISGFNKPNSELNCEKPEFIMQANIEFESSNFDVDLSKDLSVDENNLISSMVSHTGNYGWWASVNVWSKRMLRKLKRELEKVRNNIDSEARVGLKEADMKVTEAAVNAWKDSDPRVSKNSEEMLALEELVEYSDMVMKALEHKRDMLKEINRLQCNEKFNA